MGNLGGAAAIQLEKNHPERDLKSITYNAPVWDPLGTGEPKVGNFRFSNNKDPASIFDRSAEKTQHPDWYKYRPAFAHDYHNKEQAGGRLHGLPVEGTRPQFSASLVMPAIVEPIEAGLVVVLINK